MSRRVVSMAVLFVLVGAFPVGGGDGLFSDLAVGGVEGDADATERRTAAPVRERVMSGA